MTLVGDRDRERAVAMLREHFVQGRLTLEELSARAAAALRTRTSHDLRRTLAGLPPPPTQSLVGALARGVALIVLTGAWLVFSCLLLVLFGLVLLIHGASTVEFVGFLVVWLVPTFLLSRLWRRGLTHRIRGS
jgi:Flp pilus assembly protein TadB